MTILSYCMECRTVYKTTEDGDEEERLSHGYCIICGPIVMANLIEEMKGVQTRDANKRAD